MFFFSQEESSRLQQTSLFALLLISLLWENADFCVVSFPHWKVWSKTDRRISSALEESIRVCYRSSVHWWEKQCKVLKVVQKRSSASVFWLSIQPQELFKTQHSPVRRLQRKHTPKHISSGRKTLGLIKTTHLHIVVSGCVLKHKRLLVFNLLMTAQNCKLMCLIINPVHSAVQYYTQLWWSILKKNFACKNQLVTVKSVIL